MLMLVWLVAAQAAPDHHHAVSTDKASLWEAYIQHFETDGRWGCGTGVVADLKARWGEFSVEEQRRIEAHVPLLHGPVPKPLPEVPEGAHMLPATDTCSSQEKDNRITTTHYAVDWDDGVATLAMAENFAEALEYSWQKEFEELGWKEPDGTSRYLLEVTIDGGNYAGAYTSVYGCGSVYMPYIVAGKGSFSAGTWYQDMAAHELNHASQFAYGFGHEFWFWEATATWAEEDVYPSHNGWSEYIWGYSANPWLSLNASDQNDQDIFWHMYGMAIWLFYVEENWAGEDFGQQAWEYATDHGYQYDINTEDMIEDLGYDWEEVYEGFIVNNTVMNFAEHSAFPDLELHDEVDGLPASGAGEEVQGYGQDYVWFDPDAADDDETDLRVVFDGEQADWVAILVGVDDQEVVTTVRLELEDGEGEGVLPAWGGYDDVYLVISPTEWETDSFSYEWDAEGVEPPEPEPEPDTDTLDAGDDENAKLLAGGCGCDGSGASPAWLGLLLAPLLRRRR